MAKKNAYKSYGYGYGKSFYGKAQDFGDYIERVVGEINIKLISIVITNIFMSGEYGQELEKKKFEDKDETDYLDSLQFCADLVWNGDFDLSFIFFRFSNLNPLPRVPGEAGGRPPKARHRPGQHRRPRHRPSQPPSCCSSQDL